ncbi:hypothetical protein CTAYLR_001853 [Chrysophaeum taylorii]|uniref:Enoyl reductase (ER) domain-containing protein n=1 Tax=Chrysophaeum taylorii TaxID=2483200 RepID=A0AAD7U861_9STRA|nr:hypothetical protein CTAYLR_001853 [Chrysophaeum taylorii]
MRAWVAKRPGEADVLELVEVPKPTPVEGEIRIRVRALGLNKAEGYNRMGKHGAFSGGKWALGIEAAGEVDLDPSGKLARGQKVVTMMGGMMFDRHGSYAEYVAAKRENVISISREIDFVTLATLPEAYLTAWGALEKNLGIKPGETLLVRGGTSSVGMAAIAYAKVRGLEVVATTRQHDRVEKLKALGADRVLVDDGNLHEKLRDPYPRGIDKAIELVGANTIVDTMRAMRKWGEVAFVGFVGGPPVREKFHFMNDLPNTVKLSFFGSGLLGKPDLPLDEAPLDWIADQVAKGAMPSIHARTFSYDSLPDAQRYMETNQAFGKIVVSHHHHIPASSK